MTCDPYVESPEKCIKYLQVSANSMSLPLLHEEYGIYTCCCKLASREYLELTVTSGYSKRQQRSPRVKTSPCRSLTSPLGTTPFSSVGLTLLRLVTRISASSSKSITHCFLDTSTFLIVTSHSGALGEDGINGPC